MPQEKDLFTMIQYYECFVSVSDYYRKFYKARLNHEYKEAKKFALLILKFHAMADGIEKICGFGDGLLGRLQHFAYIKNEEGLPVKSEDLGVTNVGYRVFCNLKEEAYKYIIDTENTGK